MDSTTLFTISGLVLANIGTTVLLFTWATSHASEDSRESRRLIEAIHTEMKDFHGRLISIEERTKG